MTNINSVFPFSKARLDELQDAAGITQFPGVNTWYQVMNGLVIQGGLEAFVAPAVRTIDFPAPFEKQLLGVFFSPVAAATGFAAHIVASPGLNSFQLNHSGANASYYWWAIGV